MDKDDVLETFFSELFDEEEMDLIEISRLAITPEEMLKAIISKCEETK